MWSMEDGASGGEQWHGSMCDLQLWDRLHSWKARITVYAFTGRAGETRSNSRLRERSTRTTVVSDCHLPYHAADQLPATHDIVLVDRQRASRLRCSTLWAVLPRPCTCGCPQHSLCNVRRVSFPCCIQLGLCRSRHKQRLDDVARAVELPPELPDCVVAGVTVGVDELRLHPREIICDQRFPCVRVAASASSAGSSPTERVPISISITSFCVCCPHARCECLGATGQSS